MVICIGCNKDFPTREEFMEHRKYPCGTLDAISFANKVEAPKQSKYYSSMEKVGSQFRCKLCNRHFDSWSGIGFHLSTVHGIKMTDEEKLERSRQYAKAHHRKKMALKSNQHPSATAIEEAEILTAPHNVPQPTETIVNNKTAKLFIKHCPKCNIIWDMDRDLKRCPECDELLVLPKVRRKSVRVQIQDVD